MFGRRWMRKRLKGGGRAGAPVHPVAGNDIFVRAQQCHQAGRLREAQALYRKLLGIQPDHPDVMHMLGVLEHQLGNHAVAIDLISKSISLKPGVAMAHNNLGKVFVDCGRLEDAIGSFRRAIDIDPEYASALSLLMHQMQHVCEWDGLNEVTDRVIRAVDSGRGQTPPFILLPTDATPRQQLMCAADFTSSHFGCMAGMQTHGSNGPGQHEDRITLGYLSADFHDHATAYLISELFEHHSRDSFRVIGYSFGKDDDSQARHRIVNAFDQFRDIKNTDDRSAASQINADGVDILIDLKGYTTDARPGILALKPAPVQVGFLGYPGTMGADFIDYIIADRHVIPENHRHHYKEAVVYMPDCYQVNDSQRKISDQEQRRSEHGLHEDAFVFCCFNNSYKINSEIFGIWMRLLAKVAGSQLWLLESNPYAMKNLRREAEKCGIDPSRLVFAGKKPLADHLARYRLTDLFLDTLPVNAHTTASDALWAGCPLLTCSGDTFVSRVAGSLLHCIGLPELDTADLGEYERLALHLAGNPGELALIRKRLEDNRKTSPLFDAELFAGYLETAYKLMWERWQAREDPTPVYVPHQAGA